MIGDTKEWIKKAKGDINSANILKEAGEFDTSCYHSQQAAEKYLKAILCEHDLDIPKTHDLSKLAILVSSVISVPGEIFEDCREINRYATLTRYPGYDSILEEAQSAFDRSVRVQYFILSVLLEEVEDKQNSSQDAVQLLLEMAREIDKENK